jgi:transcriptional regulator GlxA family with amidase domain
MIPLIAIPVIHSSGAFIASSATGYLAGTLSSTWLGAFLMGNAGLLAGASALTASAIGWTSQILLDTFNSYNVTYSRGVYEQRQTIYQRV